MNLTQKLPGGEGEVNEVVACSTVTSALLLKQLLK